MDPKEVASISYLLEAADQSTLSRRLRTSFTSAMAQRIHVSPANLYPQHAMSSDCPRTPDDFLVGVVEDSESDNDAQLNREMNIKRRKKQPAPIIATFHCWKLTKAVPKTKDGAPNWKRAELVQMTLPSDELESQVKKQRKAKSLIEMYEALSTDQRQQVEVLIQQQRRDETNRYARWEIAAIHREVLNNLRTRIRETTFIRVILCRDDRRKVQKAAPDHETTSAGIASNISDLNGLSNPLLKQTEIRDDQDLPSPRRPSKGQLRSKRPTNENVIDVMPDFSIENTHVINVPSMASSSLAGRQQNPDTAWSNQAPLWQSSSIDIGQEDLLRNQPNQWQPQLGLEAQNSQQLQYVQNAIAYMANVNSNARTKAGAKAHEEPQLQSALPGPWFPRQSPPIAPAFDYNSHAVPDQRPIEDSTPQTTPPRLGPQTRNGKQDYFEHQFRAPYVTGEPSMAMQYHRTNDNTPALGASHQAIASEAHRKSPSANQVPTDADWPDYNPDMEPSRFPSTQAQQTTRHERHSAERLRREDVLFWRTQTQLSHSRSSSNLDDQSSTLASLEQSSPPTSISGDGVAPQFQYRERDSQTPGRFGQQLAAHDFLCPNQDRQHEQPQRDQTAYRPPTRRGVSFEDESLGINDRQHAPHPILKARETGRYSSDNYTRPSAPEPPDTQAQYSPYQPQRYQPQQSWESNNTSMLERLNERLDHMELRQAEGATRKAVEAAQKRRELEKKEAYERGVEDAMAWKARSGMFGSFG